MTNELEILEFMQEAEQMIKTAQTLQGTNLNFDLIAFLLWKLDKKDKREVTQDDDIR